MHFNVVQLLKGPTGARRQYRVTEEMRALDPELSLTRPLTGVVTLMRTSQGILVSCELSTAVIGACRRCLEPNELDVELSFEEEFHPIVHIGAVPFDDVPEEERDEALSIDEHHNLDLSEVLRQRLWLGGATESLCRPDCLGLCPRCGGNRNFDECQCEEVTVDPRWAALESLLHDEPE
jgi:uncharacterized protein